MVGPARFGKMKTLRLADSKSWETFLATAQAEGWRVPQVERELFLNAWRHSALVLEDGEIFGGFMTGVVHQNSGWIGNLIVPQELRGRGYGSHLFQAGLAALENKGLRSIWLTASIMGQPLYEKHGFVTVDEVERWVLLPRDRTSREQAPVAAPETKLREADQSAWGEERRRLLDELMSRGTVFACKGSVALLQHEAGMQVVGPWYSPQQCPRTNRRLLQKIMAAAAPDVELVVDLLASSPVKPLLPAAGFSCVGKNGLMMKGDIAQVDLSGMVALASLGSIG